MFGKKQDKTVVPPTTLPPGVTFHLMPGKYQGAKGTFVASRASQSTMASTATPSGDGVSSGAQSAAPIIFSSGKKIFVFWGIIAFLIFGAGGLAILLFTPRTVSQEPAPAAVEAPSEPAPESTPVPASAPTEAVPAPEPTPEPTPESVPSPASTEIISTTDTDQDGLTDAEELLYTTDATKADMDSDGYLDGQEVVNLYNPTGTAPIRLADSKLAQKYVNPSLGYTILSPASWTVRPLDPANPREVLFAPSEVSPAPVRPEGPVGGSPLTIATGEFIEVIVDDNIEGLSAVQWYAKRFPDSKPESLERLFIENLEGVWTKDGMTAYLTKTNALPGKRLLYGVTYNSGDLTAVNFRTTFKMMVNSFRVE